jgi:hypothetical protein
MSFDALAWAAKQNPGSSAAKLVLLGLAECASRPEALAFPSLASLVEFSSLDRKTVVLALDRLETADLIVDTGNRMGRTKSIKVYQLKLEAVPKTEPLQKRNGSENGQEAVPKTVPGISKGISTSRAKALSVARAEISIDELMKWEDTFPPELFDWAVEEMGWSNQQVIQEGKRFVDNCRAHGRRYKDWAAAWRNWCRSPYCKTVARAREPMRV